VSNEEWTVDEFTSVEARYVRIHFINNNQSPWAGLWEAEIWGSDATIVDPFNNNFPSGFTLGQNYPNPFNPSTTINYSIPSSSFVTIIVYDILGKKVATLVNEEKPMGSYEIEFSADGGSSFGGEVYNLTSGIYFYRLQAGSFVETKKMIYLK
ncbi:MAG: T9SS type A sorting domain-containing protein, partial [Ignavibacteriaceae bacterium]